MSRANPFGDLDDFATPPTSHPVAVDAIDRLAEASGFPRRTARTAVPGGEPEGQGAAASPPVRQQRRHVTGRNRQINIKATEETVTTLYRIADDLGLPLGAVLERALAALEDQGSRD
jgi:hypothetical protein